MGEKQICHFSCYLVSLMVRLHTYIILMCYVCSTPREGFFFFSLAATHKISTPFLKKMNVFTHNALPPPPSEVLRNMENGGHAMTMHSQSHVGMCPF